MLLHVVGSSFLQGLTVVFGPTQHPHTTTKFPTRKRFIIIYYSSLGLQPYPQKVVRPPWHPPQPPSVGLAAACPPNLANPGLAANLSKLSRALAGLRHFHFCRRMIDQQ